MDTLILIILAVCIALFIILFAMLANAALKCGKTESKFPVACAGALEENTTYWGYGLSMYSNEFLSPDGTPMSPDDYDIYSTSGESMSLCGIHDGAQLFVKKNEKPNVETLDYPKILILNIDKKTKKQEPKFKVRRAWKTVRLGNTDLDKALEEIRKEEKFKKLESSDKFPGWDNMKKLFHDEKLETYKEDYPDWDNTGSNNNLAIISTTLHDNTINFSIHPARIVKGVVECFYNKPKTKHQSAGLYT